METINGDKLRGHLETMVLSTLEQGEAHGLQILHRLEEAGCGLLRARNQAGSKSRRCWSSPRCTSGRHEGHDGFFDWVGQRWPAIDH